MDRALTFATSLRLVEVCDVFRDHVGVPLSVDEAINLMLDALVMMMAYRQGERCPTCGAE